MKGRLIFALLMMSVFGVLGVILGPSLDRTDNSYSALVPMLPAAAGADHNCVNYSICSGNQCVSWQWTHCTPGIGSCSYEAGSLCHNP